MISANTWKSEKLASLSLRHRLLWLGLITTSDDQGRGRAHPGLVRSAVFPLDDVSLEEIDDGMGTFSNLHLLTLYEAGGKVLYQIVNWWEHQPMTWARPSDFPPPDGWTDRIKYRQGNKVMESDWDHPGGFSDLTTTSPRPHHDNGTSSAPKVNKSKLNESNPPTAEPHTEGEPKEPIQPLIDALNEYCPELNNGDDLTDLSLLQDEIGQAAVLGALEWAYYHTPRISNLSSIITAARNWQKSDTGPPSTAPPKGPIVVDIDLETQPAWIR